MFAVLTDAVECYQKYLDAKSRSGRKLFADAEAWIESSESARLFSFEHICEIFDLDGSYIRAGLMRWRQDHELRKGPRRRVREPLRYRNKVKPRRLYVAAKRPTAPAF